MTSQSRYVFKKNTPAVELEAATPLVPKSIISYDT
jgi:hypothetical protein